MSRRGRDDVEFGNAGAFWSQAAVRMLLWPKCPREDLSLVLLPGKNKSNTVCLTPDEPCKIWLIHALNDCSYLRLPAILERSGKHWPH